MIRVVNVSKSYETQANAKPVINNVNLSLPQTGMCFILGKSGSGKSTLLNMLGGIISEYDGTIEIDSSNISNKSETEWDVFRNKNFGIVFQDFNLIENFTVFDNLLLPLNIVEREKSDIAAKIDMVLSYVGLLEYKKQKVSHLSGGQKQRVAIARALVKSPKIILADEPTGNLDIRTATEIFQLFKEISKQCLVIIATHDVEAAYEYADEIIEITDGNVEQVSLNKKRYKYTFREENEVRVKECSYNEIRTAINSFVKAKLSDLNKADGFDISIKVETEEKTEEVTKNKDIINKSVNKEMPLSYRNSLRYAVTSIRNKAVKNVFILMLLAIIIMLLFFAVNLNGYQSSRVLWKYCQRYEPKYLTLHKGYKYTDSFLEEQGNYISSGKAYVNTLCKVYNESLLMPVIWGNSISTNDYNSKEIKIGVIPKNMDKNCLTVRGRYPENSKEIVITDYLASTLDVECNDSIIINDEEKMQIVGILETDYIQYEAIEKINSLDFDQYLDFKIINEYEVAIVDQKYIDCKNADTVSIDLARSDVYFSQWESRLIDSNMIYGSIEKVGEIDLKAGTMPNADNEIIICEELAAMFNLDLDNFLVLENSFIDLHDEKYNDTYSDTIAMNEVFPDGYEVVGVYSDTELNLEDEVQVLLTDRLFNNIKDMYFETYIYNEYFVFNNDIEIDTFEQMNENGIEWTDPSASIVYEFEDSLKSLELYINIVVVFLGVGIALICILLISYSIKEQAKLLGIMRSVGYTKKDLSRIFFTESIFVGIVSSVIAGIMHAIVTYFCNYNYATGLEDRPFDLLSFSPINAIIVSVCCLVVCVLSTIIPVYNLSQKKPFELIHGK